MFFASSGVGDDSVGGVLVLVFDHLGLDRRCGHRKEGNDPDFRAIRVFRGAP
jgi:hypothetical protein